MTNLSLIIRDVYDAHEVILVLLEGVRVEEVHHELGDERDRDQAENHRHGPEREQLCAERSPVPLSSLLELEKNKYNENWKKYRFSLNVLHVIKDLYYQRTRAKNLTHLQRRRRVKSRKLDKWWKAYQFLPSAQSGKNMLEYNLEFSSEINLMVNPRQ